jgi:ketosteroid isomerase-like protein
VSRENLETVRQIFDGFPALQARLRAGDFPFGAPFSEDIEWDASEMALPDLGDGMVRGREAVRRFWMTWLAAWEDVSFEYELRAAGDDVVVVLIDQSMRNTQLALQIQYAQVWTFREGEIVRSKLYRDCDEALRVAGLAES